MMKLTVYNGTKILMEDSENKEYLTLDSNDKATAISNFSSWILTGHLSGIPK